VSEPALWQGGARLRGRAIPLFALVSHLLTLLIYIRPISGSSRTQPWVLISTLTVLGMLQPRVLGFLNLVDPLDSTPNLYLAKVLLEFESWGFL